MARQYRATFCQRTSYYSTDKKLVLLHFTMYGWMVKAIYCLQIFLFGNKFSLTQQGLQGLRDSCILIQRYIKAWPISPFTACKAPLQDLMFLKYLYFYNDINQKISQATRTTTTKIWLFRVS